jgi:hypothetical protein
VLGRARHCHRPQVAANATVRVPPRSSSPRRAMVRTDLDLFEVQLVDAETKEALPEWTHGGEHYVEAEPGREFVVRLRKHQRCDGHVQSAIRVDGTSIGYTNVWGPGALTCSDWGPRVHSGGDTLEMAAFEFATKLHGAGGPNAGDVGNVTVDLWNVVEAGLAQHRPVPGAWTASSSSGGMKSLSTVQGSSRLPPSSWSTTHYQQTSLIQTIVIKYRSAAGLMQLGALGKKPKKVAATPDAKPKAQRAAAAGSRRGRGALKRPRDRPSSPVPSPARDEDSDSELVGDPLLPGAKKRITSGQLRNGRPRETIDLTC